MKSGKKLWFLSAFIITVLIPIFVLAANDTFLGELNVKSSEAYTKDIFLNHIRSIENKGEITGDIITYSASFNSGGTINGNIILSGENCTISGKVNGNVTLFCNNVNLENAEIDGTLFVFGSSYIDNKNTVVTEKAYIFTSDTTLTGEYIKDVKVSSGKVFFGANIKGNVTLSCDDVTISKDAKVENTFFYNSSLPPSLDKNAQINHLQYDENMSLGIFKAFSLGSIFSTLLFWIILTTILMGVVFGLVLKKGAEQDAALMRGSFLLLILIGSISYILVMLLTFLFSLSVVLFPLAIILILVYILIEIFALVPVSITLGSFISKKAHPSLKALLGGMLLILLISIKPIASYVMIFSLTWGSGMLIFKAFSYIYTKYRIEKIDISSLGKKVVYTNEASPTAENKSETKNNSQQLGQKDDKKDNDNE